MDNYFKKLNESFDKFLNESSQLDGKILEFDNGEYFYVEKQDDKLVAGGATNLGILPEFEIDWDEDESADSNLERLYDKILEERPELVSECRESLDECDASSKENDDKSESLTENLDTPVKAVDKVSGEEFIVCAYGKNDALVTLENEDTGDRTRVPNGDLWEFYTLYDEDDKCLNCEEETNESLRNESYTYHFNPEQKFDKKKAALAKITFALDRLGYDMEEEYDISSNSDGFTIHFNNNIGWDELRDLKNRLTNIKSSCYVTNYDNVYQCEEFEDDTVNDIRIDINADDETNESLSEFSDKKKKAFTVMFFHNGDAYTGIINAIDEEDAKNKFNKYCPSCTIDRIKKGVLGFEYPYISSGFEYDMGWKEYEDIEDESLNINEDVQKVKSVITELRDYLIKWQEKYLSNEYAIDVKNAGWDDSVDDAFLKLINLLPDSKNENLALNEAPYLEPEYDSRKSFYNKAWVDTDADGNKTLSSYGTPVAKIVDGEVQLLPRWDESATTLRHVKEFLKQNGFEASNKGQMLLDYTKK